MGGIVRLNELPEGSGLLTNDDIFVFMDDPSSGGVTKKISLSQISSAIGGGGGGNPFDQNLNTTDVPTFSGVNLNGRYTEKVTPVSISTNTLTIDLSVGNLFTCNLNQNITTLTISNTPVTANTSIGFTLIFTGTGTAYVVTWPGSIKWADGVSPTITTTNNKMDVFSFISIDNGISWFGFTGGNNY